MTFHYVTFICSRIQALAAYYSNEKDTRIAFENASNGSLAYDLLSLINLQVKCNLPILRYNIDILMNSLGLKKKKKKNNKSVLCTFLSLFGLTTLLFCLTIVHGVVTGQLAPLRFDPWKVWLLFDNI